MKQMGLGNNEFDLSPKRTRKREFRDEMQRVVPWVELTMLIEPHYPKGENGRPPFGIATMLRPHFMQQWFGLSDQGMEEALHEVPMYRAFAGLDAGITRLPDETTILRFRHLLEKHRLAGPMLAAINQLLRGKGLMLRAGTVVDATLIAVPSSTKNADGERDPEMHQTKKGNNYYFGMKAYIGVDAESGLVHTVIGTAANVNDVTQGNALLHGDETEAFGDAGYQGIAKREDAADIDWHVAMRPGKRRALDLGRKSHAILDEIERLKASIRAKVEHPFPSHQAPVWLRQGPLSRPGQEHRAADHAVHAVEPVDGAASMDVINGIGQSAVPEMQLRRACKQVRATPDRSPDPFTMSPRSIDQIDSSSAH